MIKVQNKRIVRKLAWRDYSRNWKQNIMTIFAIIMTSFLVTTVCSLGGSYWKTVTWRSVLMNGISFDIQLPEPTEEQVLLARQLPEIKYAGLSVKCAVVDEYDDKPVQIRLFWADSIHWENQCVPAFEFLEGRYPTEKNEIVLSTSSLRELGIDQPELNMKIKLSWSALAENTEMQDCDTTFTLCGYYRDYVQQTNAYVSESFFRQTGASQTDKTQGNLYITMQNSLYSNHDIAMLQDNLKINDRQVLYADYDLLTNFMRTVLSLGFLILLILISGYLFVYNILFIGFTKEVRHYGQMKTLGMTGTQMRRYVSYQVIWNLVIGVPAGLAAGILISFIAVPWLLRGLNTLSNDSITMIFHPLVLGGAGILSIVGVLLGSYHPIKMVEKMAPIESVHYAGENIGRKMQNSRNGGKIRYMAFRMILRDKKCAGIVILSLFLSMTSFITINALINEKSAKNILNRLYSYDTRVFNSKIIEEPNVQNIQRNQISKLETIDGVKRIRVVYSTDIAFAYGEPLLKNYFRRLFELPLFGEGMYDAMMEQWDANHELNWMYGRLIGIDESGFELLNEKTDGDIDQEAFLNGEIAVLFAQLPDVSAEEVVGEELSFYIDGKERRIKIAVQNFDTSAMPESGAGRGYGPHVVISQSLFQKWIDEPIIELVDVDYEIPYNVEMDARIRTVFSNNSGLMITAKMDEYAEYYQTETQMRVLGNCLSIILCLLSFMNFTNLMASSIQNRKREFATLSSIGMTRTQQKKMLALEGFYYAAAAIVLAAILGLPFAHAILGELSQAEVVIRWVAVENILAIIFVLVCSVIIPSLLYEVLQKGSIVQRMRKE